VENVDCLTDKQGLSYVGHKNTTKLGDTCKHWNATGIPRENVEGNFCRNPDNDTTVWCFTTDGFWGYCDVMECKDCKVEPPPPSDCRCGIVKRQARIVGGTVAEVNEYPWMVSLLLVGEHNCGGSLISSSWILSAAHCTKGSRKINGIVYNKSDPKSYVASLGEHDRSTNNEADHIIREISRIVNHPDHWRLVPRTNDFSLLKMSQKVDFSIHQHIRPICLPRNDDNTYEDVVATTTGWGTTKWGGSKSLVLREVDVNVLSNKVCVDDYGYIKGEISEQMLCANVQGGGKDACNHDSGGPLITRGPDEENYELIGVTSWGVKCALADYPGVYARVTKQLDWISEITGGLQETCPR